MGLVQQQHWWTGLPMLASLTEQQEEDAQQPQ